MKPLPHQESPIKKALEYLNDPSRKKPEIIVAPTAAGKSFIIADIAHKHPEPILVLQPSQELLEQNIEKLFILGGQATVYSASLNMKKLSNLTYATLGSVKKDVKRLAAMGVKTVLIDECHFKFSPEPGSEFSLFMDALKPTKVIGLTATPFRLKGGMEGSELKLLNRMRPNYFKGFIDIIQIKDIIANGYWSKLVYETYTFDEKMLTVNTSGSDFTDESVKRVIKDLKINNHIYKRIKELLAEGCPSILVFADSVESCITFCEHLPDAAYLAASMKKSERSKVVRDFKAGRIKVLFNFGILTTGFDYPDLRCIIMGRPTMSLALYYQIIGRGTRISPATNKDHCLYIDYCNNVERFGMIENLTLEHIEGWGWGMFNGEILLTNVLINGLRVTKQELRDKVAGKTKKIDRIWFGTHTGKLLTELPIYYIEWLLEKSGWEFSAPKMAAFKKQLLDILEENKSKTFIQPN